MKRPHFFHFVSTLVDGELHLRAGLTLKSSERLPLQNFSETQGQESYRAPLQSLGLLKGRTFSLKIEGLDEQNNVVFTRRFVSDDYGNFDLIIPFREGQVIPSKWQYLEVSYKPGIEFLLESRYPVLIQESKKVVISDLDKTLVETKFSTTSEIWSSLRKPLKGFPDIPESIDLFKKYIQEGFHPFVLSASPHFYMENVQNWLVQKKIFTASVFLKDYRKIFSLIRDELTPKDIRSQGFYKLNQLSNIILMTSIPHELILIGDNFEADPLIYMTFAAILTKRISFFDAWDIIKSEKAFNLTGIQNTRFLNKMYQIDLSMEKVKVTPQIKIFIKVKSERKPLLPDLDFLKETQKLVEFY